MNLPLPAGCTVGILAGNGTYPFTLADALLSYGHKVVIAGIDGHFSGEVPSQCEQVETFKLGALEKTARFFMSAGADRIFLAGGVDRTRAWQSLSPDRHALSLIPKALLAGDDSFLTMVANKLESLGPRVCDPRPYIQDAMARGGLMAGPSIDGATLNELEIAAQAAKSQGSKDLGQAALVYNGKVVGLERRDGTDALLATAPGKGAVLSKVAKPGQDLRFDIPSIGASTAHHAFEVGLRAIGAEVGSVLLLEQDLLLETCNQKGISLVGISLDLQSTPHQ